MGTVAKRSLIAAAVLAINAGPLLSATPAGGWPEFRELRLETVRAAAAPEEGPPETQDFDPSGAAPKTHLYTFDLPVTNPSGLQAPIGIEDKPQAVALTAVRKGYGSYEAAMTISGGTDSFKVLKLDRGRYLVRGGEVNLTAVPGASGRYYDVSGNLPTPVGETIKFRLTVSTDGTLGAGGPGCKFTLRGDRAAGKTNTRLFSKADAVCLIALGLAIHADALSAPGPSWLPYAPGPWVRVPYRPGPDGNNPWYPQAEAGGSDDGGGGASAGKSAKSKKTGGSPGDPGGGGSGSHVSSGGGGKRRGGGRYGGGAGRGSGSGFGHGPGRNSGHGRASNGGNGGRRLYRGGALRSHGGSSGGRGGIRKIPAACAGGGNNNRAGRARNGQAGSGGGKRDFPAAKAGGRCAADSRTMAHNVENSLGNGGLRPFVERENGAPKQTYGRKSAAAARGGHRFKARYSAGAFAGNAARLRSRNVLPGGRRAAAAVPPPADYRDSLNDSPAGNKQERAPAKGAARRESGAGAELKAIVSGSRRLIAAAVDSIVIAIGSWRSAASTVWSWLKALV